VGVGFVKSYPEVAVTKILGIPEGVRTEIIIKLGYADPNQPKAAKAARMPASLNEYGRQYDQG
jgi:hypothetical protein